MATHDPLRLSDLLGRVVLAPDGTRLGVVHDARLRRDGPYIQGFGPALRLESLVFGPGSIAMRLGLNRPDQTGPWPLHVVARRALRHAKVLPWEDVGIVGDHIVTSQPLAALESAHEIGG
jgi:hypothetical protein